MQKMYVLCMLGVLGSCGASSQPREQIPESVLATIAPAPKEESVKAVQAPSAACKRKVGAFRQWIAPLQKEASYPQLAIANLAATSPPTVSPSKVNRDLIVEVHATSVRSAVLDMDVTWADSHLLGICLSRC